MVAKESNAVQAASAVLGGLPKAKAAAGVGKAAPAKAKALVAKANAKAPWILAKRSGPKARACSVYQKAPAAVVAKLGGVIPKSHVLLINVKAYANFSLADPDHARLRHGGPDAGRRGGAGRRRGDQRRRRQRRARRPRRRRRQPGTARGRRFDPDLPAGSQTTINEAYQNYKAISEGMTNDLYAHTQPPNQLHASISNKAPGQRRE